MLDLTLDKGPKKSEMAMLDDVGQFFSISALVPCIFVVLVYVYIYIHIFVSRVFQGCCPLCGHFCLVQWQPHLQQSWSLAREVHFGFGFSHPHQESTAH